MTKKVYKLKKWPKIVLVVLIMLGVLLHFGVKKYREYQYTQSYEYKLLEIGYSNDQTKILEQHLKPEELDKILTYQYNEFISEFVTRKYFIFNNLDKYLSQVITKEEDFFKYHGTEGYDYDAIVASVNVGTVDEFYTNSKKTNRDEGYSMMVNKYHELGSDFEPDDLVDIPWKYRLGLEKETVKIRKVAYDAYMEMWEAANREEGIYLLALSGYRSYSDQARVYKQYEDFKGTKYADSIAARPGYSEHQTGLSLDIYSKECQTQSGFKDSKTYAWLIKNAHKYGFILRYPEGQQKLTGYNYESWHYRYVGVELATKVYEEGITYDEYYAYYLEK
ncbi:MAG: M15 family metallopeptidase [Bacilli bacterium]|nr:M15 family metallopeptidase [Bacilli bacterium]